MNTLNALVLIVCTQVTPLDVPQTIEPELLLIWTETLNEATLRYDLSIADTLYDEIAAQIDSGFHQQEARFLFAQTAVLLADLNRVQFEETHKEDGTTRRLLGKRIDEVAAKGLKNLESMDVTSETWRMKADLYGAMIRSKYKAKKYRKKMERAIENALQQDPENPHAYISKAKLYLFAPEKHGGDIETSMEWVNKALRVNPENERALLLLAYGHVQNEQRELAVSIWEKILLRNPHCITAKKALAEN